MTAPAEVMAMASAAGLHLRCDGGALRVAGPKRERERLRPLLTEHKGPILKLLAGDTEQYCQGMQASFNTCTSNAARSASPRWRIEVAARRLELPVAEVLAQFDSYAYPPDEIDEASGWTNSVVDDHAVLLAEEYAEDRRRDRYAAMRESIAERAGIIEADGASREESEAIAVRLVQCRHCEHFTPDRSSPLAGIGACSSDGWPQGGYEHAREPAGPWCELFAEVDPQASHTPVGEGIQ